eukprot:11254855-Prorocentrum_lima.AAC.1
MWSWQGGPLPVDGFAAASGSQGCEGSVSSLVGFPGLAAGCWGAGGVQAAGPSSEEELDTKQCR